MTKRDPTDSLNPTLLEGEAVEDAISMPSKPTPRDPPSLEQTRVTTATGWPCRWDSHERQFVASHPQAPWLRVYGRTAEVTVARIQSLGNKP